MMTNDEADVWQRVQICRHPDRPRAAAFIQHICEAFEELHGDRLFSDDPAIIGGMAYIEGERCMLIGQEKGSHTEERLKRNFGMPHPEGYRKALRLMKLAEKFQIPVVTLIDTPGAYPGLSSEERGQGWAIANNLFEMVQIKVPIIGILIGEGCSGGALGIGIGDVIGMLEHAYYSVISPEGCASILWKDATKCFSAAKSLKMQAEHLLKDRIIDEILKEPQGGAHLDPFFVYGEVKRFICEQIKKLFSYSIEKLLENRYRKFRNIGKYKIV